jgi:hypothetical protein
METLPRAVPLIPVDLDRRRHFLIRKRDVRQAELVFAQEIGTPRTFLDALLQLLSALQQDPATQTMPNVTSLSVTNLCVLTWLALRHEDPTLTLEDVEEMLPVFDLPAMMTLATKLFEAWQAQTPPPPATAEAPATPGPLALSTGPATGPLPA